MSNDPSTQPPIEPGSQGPGGLPAGPTQPPSDQPPPYATPYPYGSAQQASALTPPPGPPPQQQQSPAPGYPPADPGRYQPASAGSDPVRDHEWRAARKRVEARRGLAAHAATYVVVNLFLIVIWSFSGGGYFWPIWVLAGWGVGLALNIWEVLFRRPVTHADIEREINRGRQGR